LAFKPVRVLDAEEHAVAIEQGQSAAAKSAITMTVAEMDNAKPPAKLEAKAEAKVESVAVEVEAVEEPTKRTAKKEEAPAPKKDISKLLTEWDDA
jgi:dihydroorotase-like cyclic amidohydrolase